MMHKTGIIGAGPAGLTAAIQLARSGIQPLVFECNQPGGLLHEAHVVENYPGFPKGIHGPKLAARMLDHARQFKIQFHYETVNRIDFDRDNDLFVIQAGSEWRVSHLIIASGTRPGKPQFTLPANTQSIHSGICTLRSVKRSRIGIIGGGDAAFDYAIQLSELENNVVIFHRGSEPHCLPILRHRSSQIPTIKYCGNSPVTHLEGYPGTEKMGIEINHEPVLQRNTFNHVLLAIGREPAIDFMTVPPDLSEELKQQNRLAFAGDVQNNRFRQCAIAAGDGLRAAMQIAACANVCQPMMKAGI